MVATESRKRVAHQSCGLSAVLFWSFNSKSNQKTEPGFCPLYVSSISRTSQMQYRHECEQNTVAGEGTQVMSASISKDNIRERGR